MHLFVLCLVIFRAGNCTLVHFFLCASNNIFWVRQYVLYLVIQDA